MIFKSYVSGPKWAGLKQALFQGSVICSLDLTILGEDKGWIRTTIYFQLEGEKSKINDFVTKFIKVIEENNK